MESTEMQSQPNEAGTDTSKKRGFRQWMNGDILTTEFVRSQIFLFLLFCVIAIFYIDNRFACEQQIVKINRLKEQLTNAKYEALTTSSILMQISRQSQISTEVNSKGIDLQPSSEPAIKVDENEQ
jgi:hypothetical protein